MIDSLEGSNYFAGICVNACYADSRYFVFTTFSGWRFKQFFSAVFFSLMQLRDTYRAGALVEGALFHFLLIVEIISHIVWLKSHTCDLMGLISRRLNILIADI